MQSGNIKGHCFITIMIMAAISVAVYKPYSLMKINISNQHQKVLIRNYYDCLTGSLILFTIDTVLDMYFELCALISVTYLASICLHTAHEIAQLDRELSKLDESKNMCKQAGLEEWKKKHRQLVKTIEMVDLCVNPYTCYSVCIFTYGVLAAIYSLNVWCEHLTVIYSMKIVMKALLPLGTLMICAVTVDWQVGLFLVLVEA